MFRIGHAEARPVRRLRRMGGGKMPHGPVPVDAGGRAIGRIDRERQALRHRQRGRPRHPRLRHRPVLRHRGHFRHCRQRRPRHVRLRHSRPRQRRPRHGRDRHWPRHRLICHPRHSGQNLGRGRRRLVHGKHHARRGLADHIAIAGTIGSEQIGLVVTLQRRAPDIFHLHLGRAVVLIIQHFGGFFRQVDHTVPLIGAAIVDAHNDGTAVRHIGDARIARQRHGRMRRRQAHRVIDLSIGRQAPVERVAIPRCPADGGIMLIFLGIVPAALDHIGLADLIAAATVRHPLSRAVKTWTGLYAVFGFSEIFLGVPALGSHLRRRGAARQRACQYHAGEQDQRAASFAQNSRRTADNTAEPPLLTHNANAHTRTARPGTPAMFYRNLVIAPIR